MTIEDHPLLQIVSDMGLLVVYDPAQLQLRVKSPRSWYEGAPFSTEERRRAAYAAWPFGKVRGSREWRVRLGAGLTAEEQPWARGQTEPAPLRTASGEVFVGPGERLPGDGFGYRISAIPLGGGLFPFPAGEWSLVVHVLDWRPDDRFWTEENEPTPDAPPDFVIVATPAPGALPPAPAQVPALIDLVPRKGATASSKVSAGSTWRSRHREEVSFEEKPARAPRGSRTAASGGEKRQAPAQAKVVVRPGEMCVGATVRHPHYGVGTVVFVRDGFPKARVIFQGQEEKVEKSDLTVVS